MTIKHEQVMKNAIEGINRKTLNGKSIVVNKACSQDSGDGFRCNGVYNGRHHEVGGKYSCKGGGDGYGCDYHYGRSHPLKSGGHRVETIEKS